MQDIANELGVSRLTVSSVINGKSLERNISQKTIDRIQDYLKLRGYVPSSHALALKNKNISTTGILCSGHLYSHLLEAFNIFTNHFISTNQAVEIVFTRHDQTNQSLKNLLARGISNLIWIHSGDPAKKFIHQEETFALLKHVNTTIYNYHPHDHWNAILQEKKIKLIGIDRTQCFVTLATFIKELNHQNVFLLSSDKTLSHVFQEKGLNITYFKGKESHDLNLTAKNISKELIKLITAQKVTIANFRDDDLAGFVMQHLIQAGIRIPQDISIIGFDGMSYSACFEPSLTTLKIPVNEMVKDALSDLPLNNERDFLHLFKCQIISRKSHSNL